jgi:FtsP/CotA-like multicopper oxidase with cupredoxin domain
MKGRTQDRARVVAAFSGAGLPVRRNSLRRCGLALGIGALCGSALPLQATAASVDDFAAGQCARPAPGAAITEPAELRSHNGELHVSLTIKSARDAQGHTRYCYLDAEGHQAPTLRLRPGDLLYLKLLNRISPTTQPTPAVSRRDPCAGGTMSAAATNLHFHGLSLPPVCHQDETLRTLVQPGDPPFEYRLRIAAEQPPGLYWYHPHVHGFSEQHLLGGASGAIVVEGLQGLVPELKDLPERVLIVRDEWMPSAAPAAAGPQQPTKQLSINYMPLTYPDYLPARLEMRPGARELWRVLNASADTYLYLYVEFADKRQLLGLVARDGVPLALGSATAPERVRETTFVFLPPGARAEFIVTAPDSPATGRLMTGYVNRGVDDAPALRPGADPAQPPDQDPTRPLVAVNVSAGAASPPTAQLLAGDGVAPPVRAALVAVRPVRSRALYFSEAQAPGGGTDFFISVEGTRPAVFEPSRRHADISVRQGTVEDWKIENRSREVHTFHVHQLHFLVVAHSLQPMTEPDLLDTINVPAWRGFGPYPSVTVRMDFRDRRIVGLFPFHCHIAQHLDGGMMGTVRVVPAGRSMHATATAELH